MPFAHVVSDRHVAIAVGAFHREEAGAQSAAIAVLQTVGLGVGKDSWKISADYL
jgi:hypothetical protein